MQINYLRKSQLPFQKKFISYQFVLSFSRVGSILKYNWNIMQYFKLCQVNNLSTIFKSAVYINIFR